MTFSRCSFCGIHNNICFQVYDVESVTDENLFKTTLKVSKISKELFCSDCFFDLYDFDAESSNFTLDKAKVKREVTLEPIEVNINSLNVNDKYFLSAVLHILNNDLLNKLSDHSLFYIASQLLTINKPDLALKCLENMSDDDELIIMKSLLYDKLIEKYFEQNSVSKANALLKKFSCSINDLVIDKIIFHILILFINSYRKSVISLIDLFNNNIYYFPLILEYIQNINYYYDFIFSMTSDTNKLEDLINSKDQVLNKLDDLLIGFFDEFIRESKLDLAFSCIQCISNEDKKNELNEILDYINPYYRFISNLPKAPPAA